MKVKIGEETEKMFREAAMHEFGFQKGSFSLAAEQALGSWAQQHREMHSKLMATLKSIQYFARSITMLHQQNMQKLMH